MTVFSNFWKAGSDSPNPCQVPGPLLSRFLQGLSRGWGLPIFLWVVGRGWSCSKREPPPPTMTAFTQNSLIRANREMQTEKIHLSDAPVISGK